MSDSSTYKTSPLSTLDEHYDVVVVGAGIVGAGIFRDLALHGLKCLIIDKKDFTSQTSQASSKMLHGGIRYLENLDFALVWEALHEKNLWLKIAPHLCYEDAFYLPVFKESAKPRWMLKIGLFIYDFLSGFQNTPHRLLSKEQTIKEIPHIKQKGLSGAGVYYDAVMDDVKMTLEVIFDGLVDDHGCHAANYVECTEFSNKGKTNYLKLKDTLTGETKEVSCGHTVMALGPFADQYLMTQKDINWTPKLNPSKGSHLWIKRESLDITHPMVLNTIDGRIIFVIPHHDAILVGTTEEECEGDFFDLNPSEKEINYLIQNLNEYFPGSKISQDCILSSFAGVRPLVKDESSASLKKTSRVHHNYQPFHNLHIILGGKYTTFRVMGQDISRTIVESTGESYNSSRTKAPLRQPSVVNSLVKTKLSLTKDDLEKIMDTEFVRTYEDLIERRLGLRNTGEWIFDLPQEEVQSFFQNL